MSTDPALLPANIMGNMILPPLRSSIFSMSKRRSLPRGSRLTRSKNSLKIITGKRRRNKKGALSRRPFLVFIISYLLISSTIALKALGWFIARSARVLRFRVMLFSASFPIKTEYDKPNWRTPALIRVIHRPRKFLFFVRRSR